MSPFIALLLSMPYRALHPHPAHSKTLRQVVNDAIR
jgi:hypothetical protein